MHARNAPTEEPHVTSPSIRNVDDAIREAIRRAVRRDFDDASSLAEIGMDSLAVLRVVTALSKDPDREVDLAEIVDLRTVGEFRHWLRRQAIP
ncbi:acyl carrier protein [Burkholderia pseudomallei]|uniref:acyl carrier protein n=1 Tax=Burkholderia pseudomallei TaxID=28450 RepID=UPI001E324D02|nr:acyl carrier protein [Burkholderia pseudomallei]